MALKCVAKSKSTRKVPRGRYSQAFLNSHIAYVGVIDPTRICARACALKRKRMHPRRYTMHDAPPPPRKRPPHVVQITAAAYGLYALTAAGRVYSLRGGRWYELPALPLEET